MRSNVKKSLVALSVLSLILFPLISNSKTKPADPDAVTLTSDNLLVLNSEVNGESLAALSTEAKNQDKKLSTFKEKFSNNKKPLYLFLHTPGGSVQSGLEMIETLKGIGRPINTVTFFAASMGFQLVQSFDDRLILKNGVLMSHHVTGISQGEFGGSIKTQMENRQQLWNDRIRELDNQTVKRSNGKQTYESYTKAYDHELWLTGTESVEQGYADKIVTIKCDSSLDGFTTHHINFMGIQIDYDLDKCPINSTPMNVRISMNADQKPVAPAAFEEIKKTFLENYESKYHQVIPMTF